MKKLLFTVLLSIFSCALFGQDLERLFNPQAKNSKPWQTGVKGASVSILAAPADKPSNFEIKKFNYREITNKNLTALKEQSFTPLSQWKGPKAKNKKPWK